MSFYEFGSQSEGQTGDSKEKQERKRERRREEKRRYKARIRAGLPALPVGRPEKKWVELTYHGKKARIKRNNARQN